MAHKGEGSPRYIVQITRPSSVLGKQHAKSACNRSTGAPRVWLPARKMPASKFAPCQKNLPLPHCVLLS